MKTIFSLLLLCLSIFCHVSHAGTQVLGFEIGKSTYNEVKQKLAKQTKVVDAGLNRFSNGPALATSGDIYDVKGLSMVLYAFDQNKKLVSVLMEIKKNMDIDNDRFDELFETIAAKYKVVSKKRPFVGDAYAKFSTPDAVIEITSPHMSTNLSVIYATKVFMEVLKAQQANEANQKKQKESANF